MDKTTEQLARVLDSLFYELDLCAADLYEFYDTDPLENPEAECFTSHYFGENAEVDTMEFAHWLLGVEFAFYVISCRALQDRSCKSYFYVWYDDDGNVVMEQLYQYPQDK